MISGMYTLEFQKKGLPHAHVLLWLSDENKLENAKDIDQVIPVKLSCPDLYPKLESKRVSKIFGRKADGSRRCISVRVKR